MAFAIHSHGGHGGHVGHVPWNIHINFHFRSLSMVPMKYGFD